MYILRDKGKHEDVNRLRVSQVALASESPHVLARGVMNARGCEYQNQVYLPEGSSGINLTFNKNFCCIAIILVLPRTAYIVFGGEILSLPVLYCVTYHHGPISTPLLHQRQSPHYRTTPDNLSRTQKA